jgi:hypothetical protein
LQHYFNFDYLIISLYINVKNPNYKSQSTADMGLGDFLGKAGAALAGALGTAGVLGALTGQGGVSQSAMKLSAPSVKCACSCVAIHPACKVCSTALKICFFVF